MRPLKIKTVVILIWSLFVGAGVLQAQQKYGHVNSGEVLEAMPEFKTMNAAIEKRQKDSQLQMQKMYQDYQARQKELSEYGMSMMMAVREEKMAELDSLQQAISGYEAKAGEDLQRLQEKLIQPLNDKYIKTVNVVAKENGYQYIFDIAGSLVVYYPENSGDITQKVKQKMGIN